MSGLQRPDFGDRMLSNLRMVQSRVSHLSLRAPRCGKHPSHLLVGVCAFCLRERLAGLADVEFASDSTASHTHSKKKRSPGHSLPTQGLRCKPLRNKGIDHPIIVNASTQFPPVANNAIDEPIASKSSNEPFARVHPHSLALAITGSENPDNASSVTHAHRNVLACAKKALVEHISSPKPSPKPNKLRGSDIFNGATRDKPVRSVEIPAGRPSFSSAKRLSLAPMETSKLPPVDIKLPILEDNQHAPMEAKGIKLAQKHASIECTSPLAGIDEQARLAPADNTANCATLIDMERGSFNAILGTRGCIPPSGARAETDMSVKDVDILLSDASPNHPSHIKKTLSSLFSLDDAEFSVTKVKTKEPRNSVNAKGEAAFNGSLSAPVQNVLQTTMSQRKCRHGSFSERVEASTYLFPVPETGNSKPLSWFSLLFRRWKKKTHPKSVEALASFSEHNNGWEDARQSWEAPRPSSWEQFRFSSFEGPRSSWEPARPSWEGVMRNSNRERERLTCPAK